MTKVIKIRDENYRRLLTILHELENTSNERASFDDAISLLIDEHEKKKEKFK
jgi:predicted CopG family antitoxin